MTAREDAGLAAVARVRRVREQDDRIGLQLALAESRAKRGRVDDLLGQLVSPTTAGPVSPQQLLNDRTAAARVGQAVQDARRTARSADVVSADARARWEASRTRLSAVEQLLEKRAARRRAAVERSRSKEADDLASQSWLRVRTGANAREEGR